MTLVVTHSKVSTKPVGSDSSRIYSDSWNANHALTGTVDASQLNANVVQSVTNDTNIQGSISAQNLTFSWAGTLAASRLNGNVVQSATNDTNITGTISAQNITLGWTGTLAAARLNSNVVQSVTNDTNITGTVSAQNLTFGWSGTLGVARGGLGGSLAATGGTSQVLKQTTLGGAVSVGQLAFTDISGSVAATQMPALTGDVTTAAGAVATTIAANAVTNAKMATMAAYTLKGNATGSTAVPTDIDVTALTLKASPVSGDIVLIQDSAASNAFRKTTVGALSTVGSVSSFNSRTGAVVPASGDYTIAQITTTATNNNASAGQLGEYISSNIASGSAVALTNAVAKDITSISLTAGDWDVEGNVVSSNSGTITAIIAAISTTSNTLPTPPNSGMYNNIAGISTTSNVACVTGRGRLSLASTTTVYLEVFMAFTGSVSAYGFIGARRVR